MLMSIVAIRHKEIQVDCVANILSLKRYVYANDNNTKNDESSRI